MVRPRVVLSESKIRTRKTPICLSSEPLARSEFGGAWGVPFWTGFRAAPGCGGMKRGRQSVPFPVLFPRDATLASLGHGRNRHLIIVRIADTLAYFNATNP